MEQNGTRCTGKVMQKGMPPWSQQSTLLSGEQMPLVAEFRLKQRGYMAKQLHLGGDTLAVMELMQRHGLTISKEFYLQRYT